jgi:hypothetical protein
MASSASFHARPYVISNRHAPACFWSEAQVPYVPPGQGEQDKYVDFTAKKGDRVKIAQAFVGHYPTLCKVRVCVCVFSGGGVDERVGRVMEGVGVSATAVAVACCCSLAACV